MPRKRPEQDHLQDALEALDQVHASVLALANAEHADEETLIDDEERPEVLFDVDGDPRPKRGEVSLDARVTLSASVDEAEAIAFALLRQVREQEQCVQVAIDGRLLLAKDAVLDLARALKAIE